MFVDLPRTLPITMTRSIHTLKISSYLIILSCCLLLSACMKTNHTADASGSFEATEVIVSAESNGRLLSFLVEEGDTLKAEQVVGSIDSLQLYLRKKQLQLQIAAVLSKRPDEATQLATVQEQLSVARREQQRFEQLLKNGATTQKIVDDISGQVVVLQRQYEALKTNLNITRGGLQAETLPLLSQIDQIQDQLSKCSIVNPIQGTVLTKYAEQSEIVGVGKALYKIADLHTMSLRAYISAPQLAQLKLGQTVHVFVDQGADAFKQMSGTLQWVSSKAEFTPKTIQTKEERTNLVYAIKVSVVNDGSLKIGMYGEIRL